MVQPNVVAQPNVWPRTIEPIVFARKVLKAIHWFLVCAACANTTRIVVTMKHAIDWTVCAVRYAIQTPAHQQLVVKGVAINPSARANQAQPAIRMWNALDIANSRNVPRTQIVQPNWPA